ncbi:MAG: serine hydrolase, partial [Candidatus Sulfotelmatobacter sp.]
TALAPASREQLIRWLVANKTGDTRLRAGFPRDWRIGDKTGSGDHGTANDIAIAWPPGRKPVIVAVYLTETTVAPAARDAAIAAIGRTIAEMMASR